MHEEPLLQIKGIGKQFPGVRALHDVQLSLAEGEVLAVVGENGAGKSTLMKILAGVHSPDRGEIRLGGLAIDLSSVRDAQRLGICLIHQELNLADNLGVGANIFLGREPSGRVGRWLGMVDRRTINERSREVLQRVGLNIEPNTLVHTLPIGQQQLVEIAKAISVESRVLIMDEPTSSLSDRESERLFQVIKALSSQGVSIIYISHRLGEIQHLADRVLVLRDGLNAGELSKDEISRDKIVRMMVGRDVSQFYARTPHEQGDAVLKIENLVTPSFPTEPVNAHVRAGEVVGLAGLVGAGRTELLRTVFGIDRAISGRIRVGAHDISPGDPVHAIHRGLALVPEDRKAQGLLLEMSVRDNISVAALRDHLKFGGWMDRAFESRAANDAIQDLSIRVTSPNQITRLLSGGNQQKVVLGKWLATNPSVLLLDEPTRGVDVGAKHEIYRIIENLAKKGLAILLVSSEMEEIIGICDRVLVMHEGRITGELSREQFAGDLGEEAIMKLATSHQPQATTMPTAIDSP